MFSFVTKKIFNSKNEQKQLSEVISLWKTDKKLCKNQRFRRMYYSSKIIIAFFLAISTKFRKPMCKLLYCKIRSWFKPKPSKTFLIVLKWCWFGLKQMDCFTNPLKFNTLPSEKVKNRSAFQNAIKKNNELHIQEHFTFRNLGVLICLSSGMRIGEIGFNLGGH